MVGTASALIRRNLAVILIALGGSAVMLAFAGAYGLHRDEMYFIVAGRHPDFGYIDQPPLTPLIAALSAQIFGVSAFGIRIVATIAYAAVVLLAAAIARELGGRTRAQAIAALTVAVSGWIAVAHLTSTETFDILGWTVLLLLLVRLLRGGDQRLWLLAGAVAGIALENKNLIVYLALGLAAGVALARRWDLVRNRWVWAAAAVALAIWAPNLAWQATHGWPQLEMARVIAQRSGDENRSQLILIQFLFAGPFLFPVALAGLWWLLRSGASTAWRPIGWAYPVMLVLIWVTQGKGYYAGGLIPTLIAAGSIPTDRWLDGRFPWPRRAAYVLATAVSGLAIVSLSLPVVPASQFPTSDAAKINSDSVSEYGWPSYVAQVTAVVDRLSSADRSHVVILTVNYGEAGALALLDTEPLPPVISSENSYATWGLPDDSRTVTVLVMNPDGDPAYWSRWIGPCSLGATIDLGFPPGVGEEQGAHVWVCGPRIGTWQDFWPHFSHIG